MASDLLDLSEEELVSIPPDARRDDVVFSKWPQTPYGFPEEASSMVLPEEKRGLPSEYEDSPGYDEGFSSEEREEWSVALTKGFIRDAKRHEETHDKMMGAILNMAETGHPPSNVERVQGKSGLWRYRSGDYRLIYSRDKKQHSVCLEKLEKKSKNTYK